MKASEFIMAKALEHDDFRLTKIAQELYETENDIEYITKEAGPVLGSLISAGKSLLGNSNVLKQTLMTAGVGAGIGALEAKDGERMSGAMKGGLMGGVLGGVGTLGKNISTAMAKNPKTTFTNALTDEFRGIGQAGTKAFNRLGQANEVLSRQAMASNTVGRSPLLDRVNARTPQPNITTTVASTPATTVPPADSFKSQILDKYQNRAKQVAQEFPDYRSIGVSKGVKSGIPFSGQLLAPTPKPSSTFYLDKLLNPSVR